MIDINKNLDIKFIPLEIEHLSIMLSWYNLPHVNTWYGKNKSWSLESISEYYIPRINNKENVPSFIININELNMGFIQYYLIIENLPENINSNNSIWETYPREFSVGIDMFIGNIDFLGKGYSSIITKNFIKNIIPKKYNFIFVDPSLKNTIAIKSYLRSGFKEVLKEKSTTLMILDRKVGLL